MKKTRHLIALVGALVCFIVLICPFISHAADDTDIYNITTNVKPNVLIIFDNSISMSSGTDELYNDSSSYGGSYDPTKNYSRTCTRWNSSHTVCRTFGSWRVYTGTFNDTSVPKDGKDDSSYPLGPDYCQRGNRINFDTNPPTKMTAAKEVTKSIIDATYEYARLGIMTLNGGVSCFGVPADYHKDNTVLSSNYGGSPVTEWTATTKETILKYNIDHHLSAIGATPLAVRLINAAQYFKHVNDPTFGNFAGFTDPVSSTYWCRNNFVIIVTDGMPTWEGNTDSLADDTAAEFSDYIGAWFTSNGVSADYDGDGVDPNSAYFNSNPDNAPYGGSDYLDDVAKYLYDTDLRPEITAGTSGKQNITTFVVGFDVDDPFLQRVADDGHGTYQTAFTSVQLEAALRDAMATILDRAQTFTAPVVPVQRTTSGDKMYVSLFTPQAQNKFWPGYLMKLHIGHDDAQLYGSDETTRATVDDDTTAEYDLLLDSLLAPTGTTQPKPYWEAHKALKGMDLDDRDIYTYVGTSSDLNDSSNIFVDTNTAITYEMLGDRKSVV